jgi:hypothetical protein
LLRDFTNTGNFLQGANGLTNNLFAYWRWANVCSAPFKD